MYIVNQIVTQQFQIHKTSSNFRLASVISTIKKVIYVSLTLY